MANEIITQPFLLLNLSDGESTQTYVHIMYSSYSDGTDFSSVPNSYMGIYAGPLEQPPKNKEDYTWSKIEGSSTYMDFRYSDDNGESFTGTDGMGTIPGAWLGVGIFEEDVANNPDYIPNINDYTWTKIQGAAGVAASYYIQYKKKNLYKFCQLDENTKEPIWVYSPEKLEGQFCYPQNGLPVVVENATIKFQFRLDTVTVVNYSISQGDFSITLDDILLGKEIDEIIITCSDGTVTVLVESIPINYGTSEEMLRFIINLDSFNAAIFDTSLKFDESGLTVTNGSFKLLNNKNESVFSVDENGNIQFSGSLNTMSGNLGGWIIDEYGLYSGSQKNVGLYASNKWTHILEPVNNPSPIRFWAGYNNTVSTLNENELTRIDSTFAVTENGTLYASNAHIQGSIIATSGKIENDFLIGNENYGIIINGQEKESSISTAQFSSGAGGYGWKISSDGTAEFNNILARGKIQSSVFEYNKISSIGGDLYIAPTIYVENRSDEISYINNLYTVSWDLPYNSKTINGRLWEVDDVVKLEGKVIKCDENDLIITSYDLTNIEGTIALINENKDADGSTKNITLTITFISTALPVDTTNLYFYPGTAIILYGRENQRNGIYLTAAGIGTPYIEVYNHSLDNTEPLPAVRLGNLSGISDKTFPTGSFNGYGLYTSNAFLRGQLMLPGVGLTNQNWAEINGSPVRIWAGKKTEDSSVQSINEAPFIVTEDGSLYASKGIFKGIIEATNGTFSGSIRTAGIMLDRKQENNDSFYVAYNTDIEGNLITNPSNNNDYLLNINYEGISIWEGGLYAYSDQASAIDGSIYFSPIYGYDKTKNPNPYPYFYLVDEVNDNIFDGRFVSNKAHFFSVKDDNSSFSIIIKDGLWFSQKNNDGGNFKEIETKIYASENSYKTGINLINNYLTIQNNTGINITNNNQAPILFNGNEEDLNETKQSDFVFRGNIKITNNDISKNQLAFNNQNIKEINISKSFTLEGLTKELSITGLDIIIS